MPLTHSCLVVDNEAFGQQKSKTKFEIQAFTWDDRAHLSDSQYEPLEHSWFEVSSLAEEHLIYGVGGANRYEYRKQLYEGGRASGAPQR